MKATNKGFLYYAYNNNAVNYLKLAICSALSGRYHLDEFRATLITDQASLDELEGNNSKLLNQLFEEIKIDSADKIKTNNMKTVIDVYNNRGIHPWINNTRPNAFYDTPYDETMLIDADYIFQNSNEQLVWGSKISLRINRSLILPINSKQAERSRMLGEETLSTFTVPLYWATVVYFNKDEFSKTFFDLISHIQENYEYYLALYQIEDTTYRNDYSFSIALHIMNGFLTADDKYDLPFKYLVLTTMDSIDRIDTHSTKVVINTRNYRNPWNLLNTNGLSYHCMNKISLLNQFDRFLEIYN